MKPAYCTNTDLSCVDCHCSIDGMDCHNNPIQQDIDIIKKEIDNIDKKQPRTKLPLLLRPILKQMTKLDAPTTEALFDAMKDRFEFQNKDISAYKKTLKKLVIKNEDEDHGDGVETNNIVPGLITWMEDTTDGKIKYIISENDKMKVCETVTVKGRTHRPKKDTSEFVNIPDETFSLKSYNYDPAVLLKNVEEFIKAHVELPENKNYIIPALWALHTYLAIDKQETSPMMVFHGLKESGKSRAAEVLAEIAYCGYLCTAVNETNMWHIPKTFNATLLIEELKMHGKNPKEDLESVMKTRYKKGVKVARMDAEAKGNTQDRLKNFSTFGPTVIATTEKLGEYIDSRSIEFLMTKNDRPEVEGDINKNKAKELRERLLFFRHYWLNKDLPKFESRARGRKGEKFNPLFQILVIANGTPEQIKEFTDFMTEAEAVRKAIESESKQAEIAKAIIDFGKGEYIFEFKTLDILDIIDKGKEKNDPHRSSPNWLGAQIRQMHFKEKPGGSRIKLADEKTIRDLCDRYNIVIPKKLIIGQDIPF